MLICQTENMTYSWGLKTLRKQKWLLCYNWRSSSASLWCLWKLLVMQLLFSICNLKWAMTISVILASSSRHQPEYLFILDLVNVEMGFPNRGCCSTLQRPMVTNGNYLLNFRTLYNSVTLFRAFRRLHTEKISNLHENLSEKQLSK